MVFKMKGSPAKLGGIQGTSGHRSALNQRSPAKTDHTLVAQIKKDMDIFGHDDDEEEEDVLVPKEGESSTEELRKKMEALEIEKRRQKKLKTKENKKKYTKEGVEEDGSKKKENKKKYTKEGVEEDDQGNVVKKDKCPAGYHSVGGKCVLTKEGEEYLKHMKKKKEEEEVIPKIKPIVPKLT